MRAFADRPVSGRERVLSQGPPIIVANHQGNIDLTGLSTGIPRRMTFLVDTMTFGGPEAIEA